VTNRFDLGALGGGVFGVRTALPTFDVLTEAVGSRNISFDTRLSEIGTVIASGLATVGGASVTFPTMPYVPIVQIYRWDGTDCHINDVHFEGGSVDHWWLPVMAVVTTSTLTLQPFTTRWFNTAAYFNPSGAAYLYSIFASE
jgi:hypothetical protein